MNNININLNNKILSSFVVTVVVNNNCISQIAVNFSNNRLHIVFVHI